MTHIYLSSYVGTGTIEDPFRPPTDQLYSAIDLRPDSSVAQGHCIVRVPEQEPSIGAYAGLLDDVPNLPGSRGVENQLGLPRDSLRDKTIRQIIVDVMVLGGADRPGRGRWQRLRQSLDGRLRIWLGELIWERAVPAGGAMYVDDFNRPDELLGASPDWVDNASTNVFEVVSQEVVMDNTVVTYGTHVGQMVLNDHRASAMVAAESPSTTAATIVAVSARGSGDGRYWAGLYALDNGHSIIVYKVVGGGLTNLAVDAIGAPPTPVQVGLAVSGSEITPYLNGEARTPITDTSLAAGKVVGIVGARAEDASVWSLDDWSAEDGGPIRLETWSAVSGANSGSQIACPAPSGVEVGDLLLYHLSRRGSVTQAPTGWTIVLDESKETIGSAHGVRIAWRIAEAADVDATYTFEAHDGTTGRQGVVILRVTGHDPADPVGIVDVGHSNVTPDVTAPEGSFGWHLIQSVASSTGIEYDVAPDVAAYSVPSGHVSGSSANGVPFMVGVIREVAGGSTGTVRGTGTNENLAAAGTVVLNPAPPPSGEVEPYVPDAILSASGLSGTVDLIQDDPAAPDADWLTVS